MAFIGHVRQSLAKAIQIASDNTVYTDLPECSSLCTVDTLSIKAVDALEIATAREKFLNKGETYVKTKFLIRDERLSKRTVITAELISGRGFVVKTLDGNGVMEVKLSASSSSSFGKILHPSRATIYKIFTTDGSSFSVFRAGVEKPILIAQKVFVSLYPIAKMMGVVDTECVYWFKTPENKVLGYIRPKLVLNGRTLIIKFSKRQTDSKLKAVMIGVGLLILLHDVYPELRQILEAGVHHLSNFD